MPLEPLYRATDLHPAYQLRYSWTGWPSKSAFPTELLAHLLPSIVLEWENDGLRVLESSLTGKRIQLTLSTTPQVTPVTLATRVKGRIQHHSRQHGIAIDFSRKLAVCSLGDPTRAQVEGYIHNQVAKEALADERFREVLGSCTVVDSEINLSQSTESRSGRYWYNLHLVLVVAERYRIGSAEVLVKIRDTVARICSKKGYRLSRLAVLPEHLHMSLRGAIDHSPEDIALAFLSNLAYALGQRRWWQAGYFAGTFGEYGIGAVRLRNLEG
jgi:REP element-mobilizing transposase RayT